MARSLPLSHRREGEYEAKGQRGGHRHASRLYTRAWKCAAADASGAAAPVRTAPYPLARAQHFMTFNSAIELPLPLASGTRVISNALRAVDARPIIRSSYAQRITWSQPRSGNSSRPSTLKANGTLNARATTFPSATPANA